MASDPPRRYPKIEPAPQSTLQEWLVRHSENCEKKPLKAHSDALFAAVSIGTAFSIARGLAFSRTVEPGLRLRGFLFAARSTLPLYCVPFVIGMQYDCARTRWERKERREGSGRPRRDFEAHDASDIG